MMRTMRGAAGLTTGRADGSPAVSATAAGGGLEARDTAAGTAAVLAQLQRTKIASPAMGISVRTAIVRKEVRSSGEL